METHVPVRFAALVLSLGLAATGSAQGFGGPALEESWIESLTWRSIGPANMGGRVTDLAVYESRPSTFWVATASGGLLKTTNNGITFEHQFDSEEVVSIGDVAVSQSNPNIVWVGTGEENPRNSASYGNGVYKSVDGGETWTNMGLERSFQIGDIAIHPTNPDIVYVGALGRLWGPNEERGLFKTTDGGRSWQKILYVDDKTGVMEVKMHPTDPNTLLVATYERKRDGFDGNDPEVKIAPGSGLYRTTDGGRSFDKVTQGLPSANLGRIGIDWYRKDPNVVYIILESEKIGMAGENVGWAGVDTQDAEAGARVTDVTDRGPAHRAGIAIDDIILRVEGATILSNQQLMELLATHEVGETVEVEVARAGESFVAQVTLRAMPAGGGGARRGGRGGRGGGRGGGNTPFGSQLGGQQENIQSLQGRHGYEHGGVYRSADAGVTWTRVNSINPRPMYFSQFRVDPSDETYQYVLGVQMSRSVDGGKTFTGDAGRGVHSDQHAMWVDPNNGEHMLVGCDGGLYATYDRTANWAHLNHMAMGQFYNVAVGPRRDYWVYGGLQDNGSWGAPQRGASGSGAVNEDWISVGGGDGFVCAVDQNDPYVIYTESQGGSMSGRDLRTGETWRIAPQGGDNRFNWKTPFILSNHNSRIFYTAGSYVFRSLDRGNNLQAISPEITRSDAGSGSAVSESPLNADVLYAGTTDGWVWVTRDGGKQWTNLFEMTAGSGEDGVSATAASTLRELVPGPRWVSSLEASRFAEGRAYMTLDGHRSDDDNPYVLMTEDYGQTWELLNANLPWGSTRVIREDIENENVLYLGTEFGAWVSVNRGGTWTRLNSNLPTVAVHEFAQHRSSGEVVAATHGRSLWILDVTPLRQMTAEALTADAYLYRPNSVVRWRNGQRRGESGGASRYEGETPPNGAEIFYSLTRPAGSISLVVKDLAGEELSVLEADGSAGLHRVTWNGGGGGGRGGRGFGGGRGQFDPAQFAARGGRGARGAAGQRGGGRGQRGGRGGGGRGGRGGFGGGMAVGTYQVVLEVDGRTFTQELVVEPDPGEDR